MITRLQLLIVFFFLLAFCFSENWLFTPYFEIFSKSTRLEVSRFFQFFQKVLAVHYSYAKIEVQIFASPILRLK